MSNLWVDETYVNRTENYLIGKSEKYESFTNDKAALFRELQRQFGKATKMFIDDKEGNPKQVGWVFSKKEKYTDINDHYIQEVWVTVYNPDGSLYHFPQPKITV